MNPDTSAATATPGKTILLPAGNLSKRDKEILGGIGKGYRVYPVRAGESLTDVMSKRNISRKEMEELNPGVNLDALPGGRGGPHAGAHTNPCTKWACPAPGAEPPASKQACLFLLHAWRMERRISMRTASHGAHPAIFPCAAALLQCRAQGRLHLPTLHLPTRALSPRRQHAAEAADQQVHR